MFLVWTNYSWRRHSTGGGDERSLPSSPCPGRLLGATLIHLSAWKRNSANFAFTAFSEVRWAAPGEYDVLVTWATRGRVPRVGRREQGSNPPTSALGRPPPRERLAADPPDGCCRRPPVRSILGSAVRRWYRLAYQRADTRQPRAHGRRGRVPRLRRVGGRARRGGGCPGGWRRQAGPEGVREGQGDRRAGERIERGRRSRTGDRAPRPAPAGEPRTHGPLHQGGRSDRPDGARREGAGPRRAQRGPTRS